MKLPVKAASAAVLLILILALAGSPARADFYRYVDENGVVHITNVPVSGDYTWIMEEAGEGRSGRSVASYDRSEIENVIFEKSIDHGVDPALVKAIVKAESDFNPGAVSEDGARGLMQLMPETARLVGVRDIDDPTQNVEGGIRYLAMLLRKYDWHLQLAVAAYNAGETAVAKYGGVPPYRETEEFVQRVLHYHSLYRGHSR